MIEHKATCPVRIRGARITGSIPGVVCNCDGFPFHYWDRKGEPLTVTEWADLHGDTDYRISPREWVVPGRVEVVVLWDGFEPYRVTFTDEDPPLIFYVSVLHQRPDGSLSGVDERYHVATEAEALERFAELIAEMRHRYPRHPPVL